MIAPQAARQMPPAEEEAPMQHPAPRPELVAEAIDFAWKQYRRMDLTSVLDKQRWLWRKRLILALTLVVIVLLPIGQALLPEKSTLVALMTWLSAVLAALIAFTNQLVGADPHQRWIRTRGAAESIKSEVFRFIGGAAPYDKTRDAQVLLTQVRKLMAPVEDVVPAPRSEAELLEGRPSFPATRDTYLADRVDDQIRFFTAKAAESDAQARRARRWTWVLSGMAVVAGASAPFLKDLGRIDGWIPVLSVLSATLATQLFLGRNEFQAGLYQSASVQLDFMKRSWLLAGEEGTHQQAKQVAGFEEALAKINGTWLSEWTQRREQQPDKPATEPPPPGLKP